MTYIQVTNGDYIYYVKTEKSGFLVLHSVVEKELEIWLADDDQDDCVLFQHALKQIPIKTQLTIFYNGEQLIEALNKNLTSPDILFLDLNMPRKNGVTCLIEIKKSDSLKQIPVIILSTSFRQIVVDQLYENGAQYYIRKPDSLFSLKNQVHLAISLILKDSFSRRSKDQFIIQEPSHLNETTE
jgi:CheY-like chemotaxis protein